MASFAIEQAKSTLTFLTKNESGMCEDLPLIVKSFNKVQQNYDKELIIFANGRFLPPEINKKKDKITKNLILSYHSQTVLVDTFGNFQSIFGFGTKDILVTIPLKRCGGGSVGMILHMQGVHESILRKQPYVMVYILVNIIILTTIGFFRMRKTVVRPLENLVQLSETYRSSDDLLSLSSSQSEFGHVASSLHSMLSRIENDKEKLSHTISSLEQANQQLLENQKTLVEAEKFAAVGKLSAGLAHEIGNPLGIIQGYIELLGKEDTTESEREQYVKRAGKELDRVIQLIQQLLDLARKKPDDIATCNANSLIHEVVEILRQQKKNKKIKFVINVGQDVKEVACSEADLHQVLLNCLLNSIDAIHEMENTKGEIRIYADKIPENIESFIEIKIMDNGCGIKKAQLGEVFDPFFTTKEVGNGTGLGLSVSRSMIENCGGSITVESENENGTVVIIRLPESNDGTGVA